MASSTYTIQELVQLYCQQKTVISNLIYVENTDNFYFYDDELCYFKLLKHFELKKKIYIFLLEKMRKNISDSMVEDFIKQIKYVCYKRVEDTQTNYLALLDKTSLNLQTFELVPSSPSLKAFTQVNCDPLIILELDKFTITGTSWEKYLKEIFVKPHTIETDEELITLAQEMFGYYLLNTLEAHATFFLIGTGANGKSVMLNILREIVGKEFSTAMSIEKLTINEFASSSLIGKKINICLEEESTFIKSDKFKAMVSGDPITVERKYGEAFMWQPTVKHIFATNMMPTFSGINHGLLRRIKLLPFNRVFSEKEQDTKITEKLLKDIGVIVGWAVQGAKKLIDNGFTFTDATQSSSKQIEFQENISAAILFFNETYAPHDTDGKFIGCDDLFIEYRSWADRRGKKTQSFYNFIKDIDDIIKPKKYQGKDSDGRMDNGYKLIPRKKENYAEFIIDN